MDKTLDRLRVDIEKHVRRSCGDVIKNISTDLQALDEYPARIQEYEEELSKPRCNLQEHTTVIHSYEDLQAQHRLTLEHCDLLRKQNESLQHDIRRLMAKQSSAETAVKETSINSTTPIDTSMNALYNPEKNVIESTNLSAHTKQIIKDNPEIGAILSHQTAEYKKLQQAHGRALGKLKECHQAIKNLPQSRLLLTEPAVETDEAHSIRLQKLATSTDLPNGSPKRNLQRYSPRNVPRLKSATNLAHSVVTSEVHQAQTHENETIRIVSSSPQRLPLVEESQPVFVSERPVKKRKTKQVNAVTPAAKLIKLETTPTDLIVLDFGHASLDLDAVHTPIKRRKIKSAGPEQVALGRTTSLSEPLDVYTTNEENIESVQAIVQTANQTPQRPVLQPKTPNVRLLQTSLQKKRAGPPTKIRDKDTNELTMNDFKLNPAMNQGFNEAFGGHNPYREKRTCPRDCSKVECCGNVFAAALRAAGLASLADMTQTQKDAQIERYLGFPLSEIRPISDQAYKKLLGEAIGKEFAVKYGKEKGSRADSPPGYWRVDFPSTQERAADGKKAEEAEREAIVLRRREALRGDGLWLFRDE